METYMYVRRVTFDVGREREEEGGTCCAQHNGFKNRLVLEGCHGKTDIPITLFSFVVAKDIAIFRACSAAVPSPPPPHNIDETC